MTRIRIASLAGDNSNESHLVLSEDADKARTVLRAFGSMQDARSYGMAVVDMDEKAEQAFPEKSERKGS
jgi:hypothetical protein